jgi:hypothetical protein
MARGQNASTGRAARSEGVGYDYRFVSSNEIRGDKATFAFQKGYLMESLPSDDDRRNKGGSAKIAQLVEFTDIVSNENKPYSKAEIAKIAKSFNAEDDVFEASLDSRFPELYGGYTQSARKAAFVILSETQGNPLPEWNWKGKTYNNNDVSDAIDKIFKVVNTTLDNAEAVEKAVMKANPNNDAKMRVEKMREGVLDDKQLAVARSYDPSKGGISHKKAMLRKMFENYKTNASTLKDY